jgi:hypothetical protein
MKVWPIDPLVPRNLRLEVPEKLPQGLTCYEFCLSLTLRILFQIQSKATKANTKANKIQKQFSIDRATCQPFSQNESSFISTEELPGLDRVSASQREENLGVPT